MNINIFAAKKTRGVVFRTNRPVRLGDLGIKRIFGSDKSEWVMEAVAKRYNTALGA